MPDRREFTAIIKENEGILFKISKIYANDTEDQKDLYQEIVYQLWKSFRSFQGQSKVSTWVYRVALNTSIRHMNRLRKKKNQMLQELEWMEMIEEQDEVKEERLQLMYEQIKQLNAVEKGIILLYLEGKSYAEIASITGFSASNVGTRLNRIKRKLSSQVKSMNYGTG